MAKIAVAMSGGVDSAVAAAMLVEQGHEVVGLTMNLWPAWLKEPQGAVKTCCGVNAIEDARATARRLGIRHYVLNLREAFEHAVIDDFCDEYARGHTPNPCVACNQEIKFRLLLEKVDGLGCETLATGHYARIRRDHSSGRYMLLRGTDPSKDQSYVLYGLTQAQMARVQFPVGEYHKDEVRVVARRLDLPVADKADSQEICFVPTGHYADLVAARRPEAAREGPIVDQHGALVGTHGGIARYTVGQRRGLGLPGTAPRYVVGVDAARNTVIVGEAADLFRGRLRVSRVNWIVPPPPPRDVTVRLRHAAADVPAALSLLPDGNVDVTFESPQRAAAPGQVMAFYDGERVVGGGTITDDDAATTRSTLVVNRERAGQIV